MKFTNIGASCKTPERNEEVVIPGNPGEGRGRPGIQDFQAILDSGFRRNDRGNDFFKKLIGILISSLSSP